MQKKNLIWVFVVVLCCMCLTSAVGAAQEAKKYYAEGYVTLFNNELETIDFRQQYGTLTDAPVVKLGEVQKKSGIGQFDNWNYSVDVTVSTGNYARKHYPIEVDIDFSELLAQVGGGSLADNSVRLVCKLPSGDAAEVVSQFDKAEGYDSTNNAKGILVWMLADEVEANTELNYTLYFDTTSNGKKPALEYKTDLSYGPTEPSGYSEARNDQIGLIIRDFNGYFEALRNYTVRDSSLYWKDLVWSDANGAWWSPCNDMGMKKVLYEGPVRVVIQSTVKAGGRGITVTKTYTLYSTGNTFKFTTLWEFAGAKNEPVSCLNSVNLWACNSDGYTINWPAADDTWVASYFDGTEIVTRVPDNDESFYPEEDWMAHVNVDKAYGAMITMVETYSPCTYFYNNPVTVGASRGGGFTPNR